MKRILILTLGALALAANAKAFVNEKYAKEEGKAWAEVKYRHEGWIDPEHIADGEWLVRVLQSRAVEDSAETSEEIDQYVNIAWLEMYQTLKLMTGVQGHKPQ